MNHQIPYHLSPSKAFTVIQQTRQICMQRLSTILRAGDFHRPWRKSVGTRAYDNNNYPPSHLSTQAQAIRRLFDHNRLYLVLHNWRVS